MQLVWLFVHLFLFIIALKQLAIKSLGFFDMILAYRLLECVLFVLVYYLFTYFEGLSWFEMCKGMFGSDFGPSKITFKHALKRHILVNLRFLTLYLLHFHVAT